MVDNSTVSAIIKSFAPQEDRIKQQLHQIAEKRKNQETNGAGTAIPLRLDTAEDIRHTKELALARNKQLKQKCPDLMSLPPLDYSFRGLEAVRDIRGTRPRNLSNYKRSSTGRFWSSALRINNNELTSIMGITDIVNQIFQVPENLTWLDISFNQISYLTYEIGSLCNLKIVYLHGNKFMDFEAVLPHLRTLPKLYSLTLHGNPIEERRKYRIKVLTQMPRLRSLDFTNVTKCDLERIGKHGSWCRAR